VTGVPVLPALPVLLGLVACGLAGFAVPALIGRLPEPPEEPDAGHPKTPYALVAAAPGTRGLASALSAGAGAVVGAAVGLDWPLLFLLPLVPVGVALAIVDVRTRLLPTVLVWPTFGAVAVLATVSALLDDDSDALVRAGAGAAVVLAAFYALWWVHPGGMGIGDVRLSAVLGLALGYVGWPELLVGIYGGFLAFAVPGLVLAVLRRERRMLEESYPFGPFLLVGALAGLVAGPEAWSHLVSG
jgi:leader peptidase (prepilin peptidase)/N-methyltransferase